MGYFLIRQFYLYGFLIEVMEIRKAQDACPHNALMTKMTPLFLQVGLTCPQSPEMALTEGSY